MSGAVRALFALLALAALPAAAAPYPEFDAEPLRSGRAVWMGTCRDCHANPDADAPQGTDRKAWAPRIAKGNPALYASALGGLQGPSGTQMPPRGGNRSLTDADVRAAVDYMTTLVSQP